MVLVISIGFILDIYKYYLWIPEGLPVTGPMTLRQRGAQPGKKPHLTSTYRLCKLSSGIGFASQNNNLPFYFSIFFNDVLWYVTVW